MENLDIGLGRLMVPNRANPFDLAILFPTGWLNTCHLFSLTRSRRRLIEYSQSAMPQGHGGSFSLKTPATLSLLSLTQWL